jgi:tetratricopeptide (TPR) repeat protein
MAAMAAMGWLPSAAWLAAGVAAGALVAGWLFRRRTGVPLAARSALWGFLSGAAATVAAGWLLVASPRPPAAPVAAAPPAPAPPSAETAAGEGLRSQPEDLDARLEQARLALGRGDWTAAVAQTQLVLDRSPGNPRALTYQALARFATGEPERAETMLQQALRSAPDLLDAYAILGLVYAKTGRLDEAKSTMERAAGRFPDRRAVIERMFDQLRSEVEAERTVDQLQRFASPGDAPPLLRSSPPQRPAPQSPRP